MLGNLKGAIFDLDGTLVDSLMIWDIVWEKLGRRFLSKDDILSCAVIGKGETLRKLI